MTIQEKHFVIDGHDYVLTQLGALSGRKIWLRLLQVITGPMKVLGSTEHFDERALASVVAATLEGLDDSTAEVLYEAFGTRCTVRVGERYPILTGEVFDQHFAGRYVAMSKWLYECVVFNFADFLGDTTLGAVTARVKATMAARASSQSSTSQNTSTGTSGESSPTSALP